RDFHVTGVQTCALPICGNPLACAVGNAVFDIMLEESFLERVRDRGLRLSQKLAMIADEHPSVVENVRGAGLMLGLKARVPVKDRSEERRVGKEGSSRRT